MTGYGRHEETIEGRRITVEIRGVNHKYFECAVRVPRDYLFLENPLKRLIQQQLSRGKVDVFLQIEALAESELSVQVNHALAAGYAAAFREIKERYGLAEEPSLSLLAAQSDLFRIHKQPANEEEILTSVTQVTQEALQSLIRMRETEGQRLREDILFRASRVMEIVSEIEDLTPGTVSDYEKRLREKILETLENRPFEEDRLLTEVAVFADKVAVDEETVRLKSHFEQLRHMADSDRPIGRKMDFLVQEMNREANTIGAKAADRRISYRVVEIKSEIEKIREQIQNIE